MLPRVKDVKPNSDYTLTLLFDNNEKKVFDVKPYLEIGVFKAIKDRKVFNRVRPILGTIQWPDGQDFCPDTLYLDGKPVNESKR